LAEARRGIGEALARARDRAGLTIAQVSQQTRIRPSLIADVERGDFGSCGGDFYARGHIRAIARAVGADPGPLIEQYDATRRAVPQRGLRSRRLSAPPSGVTRVGCGGLLKHIAPTAGGGCPHAAVCGSGHPQRRPVPGSLADAPAPW
jgi:transcriptional regulator with XRE-family HTH domain